MSVANLDCILLKLHTRLALYIWIIDRIADIIPLCVVTFNVSVALLIPMHHASDNVSTRILSWNSCYTYYSWDGTFSPYSVTCCSILDITLSFSSTYMAFMVWQYCSVWFYILILLRFINCINVWSVDLFMHLTDLYILWYICWSVYFTSIDYWWFPFLSGFNLDVGEVFKFKIGR